MAHPRELTDDLDWIAFCYFKNELADEQVEWFEAQLAENQQAREALARAVATTETVVAAQSLEAAVATRPNRFSPAPVWWMTVGAALSLCAVFIAKSIRHDPTAPPTFNPTQTSLAIAWDEMRVRYRTEIEPLDMEPLEMEPLEKEQGTAEDIQAGGSGGAAAAEFPDDSGLPPSWMESALLGMSAEDSDDEDEDEEWEGLP